MTLRAGDLDKLVTVQKPDPFSGQNAVGERDTRYIDVADVYASIVPISGREAVIAAQRQASTSHIIEMYYDSVIAAMDASWRVNWKTAKRIFTIDAPPQNDREANVLLRLSCTESVRKA